MTGQSGEVYILFTNVRDINYANSWNLLRSYSDLTDNTFLIRQESRAGSLAGFHKQIKTKLNIFDHLNTSSFFDESYLDICVRSLLKL